MTVGPNSRPGIASIARVTCVTSTARRVDHLARLRIEYRVSVGILGIKPFVILVIAGVTCIPGVGIVLQIVLRDRWRRLRSVRVGGASVRVGVSGAGVCVGGASGRV